MALARITRKDAVCLLGDVVGDPLAALVDNLGIGQDAGSQERVPAAGSFLFDIPGSRLSLAS